MGALSFPDGLFIHVWAYVCLTLNKLLFSLEFVNIHEREALFKGTPLKKDFFARWQKSVNDHTFTHKVTGAKSEDAMEV